ncbi:transcription initiation protein spt5 [Blastomyces gilchristii SLH14081]|uniref:Transcription elongation factor SPT5 n=1 Tax=Blastomyces gilchristii (strain SLH14081) TaxID=559298 RepID=A0A179UFW6_BLAGS|nr:transcription initiation protein spt5 [Blastomyces gilchristii SLH14081]OAT06168.1 transcription initiation protein spt5 [Blastomyces gilchristii SLH14081]
MSNPPSNFLNEDFGSEEEDDDFNPAPVEDSDDDRPKKKRGATPNDDVARDDRSRVGGGGDEEDQEENESLRRKEKAENSENGEGEDYGDVDESGGERDAGGSEEEEDEEDDDDDEDEQAVSGRPRKRRRRGINAFLEVEAEVDEEDDAEEDEEEMGDGFVAEHPDDLDALPVGAETDDRRHRELDRKRDLEATMDAEKQAQALKERYGRNRAVAADLVVVPKRLLLPSVDDPSIWAVKCRPGKEREIVFNIMKRIEDRPPDSRRPIRIMSAFERGGTMSGYIYVEARKQADVLDALNDMSNVYTKSKMILISVKEMPDLLRVTKSEQLIPGGWVRIKRGKYQGDLAQLEDVETNGLDVTVRLVPRLDYGLNEDMGAPNGDVKRKRPGANSAIARPPQRPFSEAEAKKKHARYLSATSGLGGKTWNYLGDNYVDGFLIKDMKVQHLITKNVNPQLDEVTKFARGADDGTANLDLAALAASLKNTTTEDSYLPGDTVEVFQGEQQGVVGRTVSTRGDIVSIKVTQGELEGQQIDVPIKGLRKRFQEGDHVKVIGGSRFRDELGMVVRIKDDRVTLLSDMSMQEITVFSKDIREAADAGVDGKLGMYDVHDLVQLDQATVGCIIKLDRESMRVLDQNGSVRTVLPSQVMNKILQRRNAVSTDRNGSEIRSGDTVREVTGEQRTGAIIHIHRSFLFLNNKDASDNAGIIVTRASNVTTVATSGGRLASRSAPDFSRMNPAIQKNGMNGSGMPPPKSFGRDRTIGKTVTIRKGPFKGLLGIVKDTTDAQARVELHSKNKVITVDKDMLAIKDPITGASIDLSRYGGRGGGGAGRGRIPYGSSAAPPDWSGSRTPLAANDASRTPAWRSSSSRTPAWGSATASGSRTPAWKADGSRTSNPYDGSRTAYGGTTFGGGRTPAWTSGTKTPYDSSSGFGGSSTSGFDAFAAGSRTPAYPGGGSRTPAWAPGSAAPPPIGHSSGSKSSYDAPTPSTDYSAPTPGPYGGAPTPGATAATPHGWADNAPTPGAIHAPTPDASGYSAKRTGELYDAPTPAAIGGGRPYDAPTPAMGAGIPATPSAGDDGGPRYEECTPSP